MWTFDHIQASHADCKGRPKREVVARRREKRRCGIIKKASGAGWAIYIWYPCNCWPCPHCRFEKRLEVGEIIRAGCPEHHITLT
jgi:hypothetical protein